MMKKESLTELGRDIMKELKQNKYNEKTRDNIDKFLKKLKSE